MLNWQGWAANWLGWGPEGAAPTTGGIPKGFSLFKDGPSALRKQQLEEEEWLMRFLKAQVESGRLE